MLSKRTRTNDRADARCVSPSTSAANPLIVKAGPFNKNDALKVSDRVGLNAGHVVTGPPPGFAPALVAVRGPRPLSPTSQLQLSGQSRSEPLLLFCPLTFEVGMPWPRKQASELTLRADGKQIRRREATGLQAKPEPRSFIVSCATKTCPCNVVASFSLGQNDIRNGDLCSETLSTRRTNH